MPGLKKRLTFKWLLFVVFLVLAVMMICFFVAKGDKKTPVIQSSAVVTYSTDAPKENKPTEGYRWPGGHNEPKWISLPSIETDGYIQKVGVDQNKQVAVPSNIHFAGWFVDSVLPGGQGLSIIDGHVDGRQATGIFKQLHNLKKNDIYQIEFGNDVTKSFQVRRVVTVNAKEAAGELFSQDPQIGSQVNLITCGGAFDTRSRQYNERIIVVSELIK